MRDLVVPDCARTDAMPEDLDVEPFFHSGLQEDIVSVDNPSLY